MSSLAMRVHQALVEPALVLALRRSRLKRLGQTLEAPAIPIAWHRPGDCRAPCPLDPRFVPKLLRRYARPATKGSALDESLRLTPMVIDLQAFADPSDFDALLKRASSRTLSKTRRAERQGYRSRPFMLASHIQDLHAIRTSMAFRAAGPVFDRWFLKARHIGQPAVGRLAVVPPCCPMHWTIWWGVFVPEAGHLQDGVEVGERLVAYVKVMRIGDVVHYTEIMGHRDRLADNVMMLLHRAIVRWLIEEAEPAAAGARILLYGALEHGGAGLLTWKKRAGFRASSLALT